MEPPTVRKLLGLGWTYCPRCDDNVMVPDGGGWQCPFCGVHVVLTPSMPMPELMVWSEPLTGEEVAREQAHLQERAQKWVDAHKDISPPTPPRRLIWFNRLVKPIAWLFDYQVMAVRDKKHKEVTSEK